MKVSRSLWQVAGSVLLASCTRSHYRESADRETYPIVVGHEVNAANSIGRIDLRPPQGSRLTDPTNPDRPPKPPDDGAAALFMQKPYRFRGSKHWGKDGFLDSVEPAGWEASLGAEPDGTLKLTQEKAVEVALANSREYQTSLENVYLTALALTLNRFEFDSRWFGRTGTDFTQVGFAGPPTVTSTLMPTNGLGFNRNLAAGGQLVVDFANSFVWEYAGGTSGVSGNFTATLIQPLLRNFGRKVRLESLTQAERDTLYAVRDFARFRKQFWVATAVDSGGYLSLLLLQQSVRNAEANLRNQEENFQLGQELLKGNKKSAVEVDAILQGFLSAQQRVFEAGTALQQGLDGFKLQMGLPPRLPIELDDNYLAPFVLVAPELEQVRDAIAAFARERNAELGNPPTVVALQKHHDTLLALAARVGPVLDAAEVDLNRWKAELARPATSTDDAERKARTAAAFKQQSDELAPQRAMLAALKARIAAQKAAIAEPTREAAWKLLAKSTAQLETIVGTAVSAQTQARIYLIRLPDVDVVEAEAVAQAKANRLDMQNRLAQVTDSWRKVTIAANQLRGDLNLITRVNLITDPEAGHPFDFSKDLSRYSVGLQFDSPLNRLAERNAYRVSLIAYQRARRNYIDLGDRIEAQIRNDIRTLRIQRFSFEIARQSLIAAARQLENEQLLLTAPNQPPGGNAGDATLRKLRVLEQLLAAREQLSGSFIRYEQQRVRLLLDLEELQLDGRGFPTNASPLPPRAPGAAPARPGTE